ncbi:efflux RND transporter periplasmic adaptor subunit [Aquisalinus flavus]|uniref:RND superfamily efflux pump MFP component n=1 Tax=Aquisalinus flavus TaxID=1526572 RepID=A0A8J2Y6A7_9PROT|nr:efflux RND transporter periplasmic adaptor subunit [Aquisalinus flavus]MBD0427366.1 efflux RND transporter periplasmic adaptor subunit [Aquisalinus flavus]UNE47171.1 efflux RND transporter periplasmic adaptor subunit [Aquisalinus flavus]GGD00457.1 RND superfamily efflux pump MFP component [Aquisalinus flavus]
MIRKIFVVFGTLITVVLLVAGFIGLIATMGAMRPKPEKKEADYEPPTVFYRVADSQPINLSVTAQGEVMPKTEIALTAQVSGKVVAISPNFANGGVIRKDEMLVQLEQEDYRLAVTQAEARVAQASQALELEEAEAQLARRDWEDLGGLESGNQPSSLTLRQPQLNQARANYASAEAEMRNARLALERTTIRAPFDGRVRSKNADVGQFISPGFVVGQLFATDVAEIRLPMSDNDLARLDLPLAFEAESYEEGPLVYLNATVAGQMRVWQGHLVRTDAAIDPGTRQISAIAEVRDPYGRGADNGFPLAMGLFVDARIEGRELENAFVVPRIAMQEEGIVYVVLDDETIEQREVIISASVQDGLVITGGLNDGDKVVVSRAPGLEDGTEVIAISPEERDASTRSRRSDAEADDTTAAGTTGADASQGAQL